MSENVELVARLEAAMELISEALVLLKIDLRPGPRPIRMSPPGIDQLKIHEGYRGHIYKCTAGYNTLGYGRNIDANPLTSDERYIWRKDPKLAAEQFLKDSLIKFEKAIERQKPFVSDWDQCRIDAIVDLTYNMGENWFQSWPNTWRMLENQQWAKAADGFRNSKYARQVGQRAINIAHQIEFGRFI